jgi:hypothetical protein
MKNKKFSIGLTLVIASSLLFTNCTKNKTNEAPSPDYEFQSTKDMARIQMIMTDIQEIIAQTYENSGSLFPVYNSPAALTVSLTTHNPVSTTILANGYQIDFNANGTIGYDGHIRRGTILVNDASQFSGAISYRKAGWRAVISTPTPYVVDNYTVTINSMVIENVTTKPAFNFPLAPNTPSTTNLVWEQTANVNIATPSTTENFNGTITKTLLNTSNSPVPMPLIGSQTFTVFPKLTSCNCYDQLNTMKQYMSYSGTGVCTLGAGPTSFTMTNMTRNMNSSPEPFFKDGTNMLITPERHPFLSGMMSFKPGSKATRDVDFGQGDIVDYNAKVTIEGITYGVDCND